MQTSYRMLVLALFFLSGVCALIYEITWMRMFRLVMGNTVFTSATVLTAFMAGLALGSYLAGRIIDREPRPLRVYAILEGAIGVYALLMPLLFGAAEPAYRWAYGLLAEMPNALGMVRFLISAVLLILPTTLMGATLPLLSRFFAQREESLGRDVGRLYAFNTLGAAVGAALTGFLLVPSLGEDRSIVVAAVANLLICGLAWRLARRYEHAQESDSQGEVSRTSDSVRGSAAVLWGLAGAGFASMIYEVAWTRILAMLIGSSVYAFTLMLVAFIAGLGAGSMILSGWIDRRRNLLAFLGLLEIAVAFAALVVVPLFNELPLYMVDLVTNYAASFATLHLIEFATVFLLMLMPTLAMGAIFPVVAKIYTRDLACIGRSVGEAYAANTLGAVLGSFVGGFIAIPLIGVQYTILAAVSINLIIGAYFVLTSSWGLSWQRLGGVLASCLLLGGGAWHLPVWDTMLFNSAPYLYAYRYKAKSTSESTDLAQVMRRNRRLLYAEEGMTATVTVVESGGEIYLKVNGKTDASSRGDLRSQSLLSHLPLLLHDKPREVLLVGLGSGISLGALEQHPVEYVECVEISAEVVEGARFFSSVNYNALADPRLKLFIGDGRNHLALSERRYDVIISQPSNLWIAGMADLFTQEYFRHGLERLAEDGVFCSWIQAYSMRKRDFKTIVKTFQSVFPHVSMWESMPGGDYFLIGTEHPQRIDAEELQMRWRARQLQDDFVRIGVVDANNLLCSFVMRNAQVEPFAREGVINTDDNAVLEFSAPKGMYQGLRGQGGIFDLTSLADYRQADLSFLEGPGTVGLESAWRARQAALEGVNHMNGQEYAAALERLQEAHRHNARDMELRRVLPLVGGKLVEDAMRRQDFQQALELCQRIVEVVPEETQTYYRMGRIYEHYQRHEDALQAYARAISFEPRFVPAHLARAGLWARSRLFEQAREAYLKALEIDPGNLKALNELGKLYLRLKRWTEAVDTYRRALVIAPRDAQIHNNIGVAHLQRKDFGAAVEWFGRATELGTAYTRAYNNLADAHAALGEWGLAGEAAERALALEPGNLRALRTLRQIEQKRR